ncbi:MAG: hypothetical protein VXY75_06915 [Bacteroidota bacterium]|nr:hypothetical protein [Bacteroidota bacterium]
MKFLISYLCFAMLSVQCASNKTVDDNTTSNQKNTIFIYKQYSRGFYKEVHISASRVKTYHNYQKTEITEKALSQKEWEQCFALSKNVNLGELETIKAPSNLRQTDRVHHGELIVENGTYNIKSRCFFDHGNPPTEIKLLVDHILHISSLNTSQN